MNKKSVYGFWMRHNPRISCESTSRILCRCYTATNYGVIKMRKLLVRWTYPIWKRPLAKILNHAYEKHIINSSQWHELSAMFDRTQSNHYLMEKKAV